MLLEVRDLAPNARGETVHDPAGRREGFPRHGRRTASESIDLSQSAKPVGARFH